MNGDRSDENSLSTKIRVEKEARGQMVKKEVFRNIAFSGTE